jgi:hypothetical protein
MRLQARDMYCIDNPCDRNTVPADSPPHHQSAPIDYAFPHLPPLATSHDSACQHRLANRGLDNYDKPTHILTHQLKRRDKAAPADMT